ncbi:MAG TPA: sugar ABC transporter substrate-binding protein, partial [Actinobacteria bacterium]|nr:sugar ABC transporter substrate-binding protein [Actinomycetota bacterium]
SANADEFYGPDWKAYGTVDRTFYAAPLGASVKSFVWYSPKTFADNGWTIPTTWP